MPYRITHPGKYDPGTPGYDDVSARQGYYYDVDTPLAAVKEHHKTTNFKGEALDIQFWLDGHEDHKKCMWKWGLHGEPQDCAHIGEGGYDAALKATHDACNLAFWLGVTLGEAEKWEHIASVQDSKVHRLIEERDEARAEMKRQVEAGPLCHGDNAKPHLLTYLGRKWVPLESRDAAEKERDEAVARSSEDRAASERFREQRDHSDRLHRAMRDERDAAEKIGNDLADELHARRDCGRADYHEAMKTLKRWATLTGRKFEE